MKGQGTRQGALKADGICIEQDVTALEAVSSIDTSSSGGQLSSSEEKDTLSLADASGESSYELERLARIKHNREKLESLGLLGAADALLAAASRKLKPRKRPKLEGGAGRTPVSRAYPLRSRGAVVAAGMDTDQQVTA